MVINKFEFIEVITTVEPLIQISWEWSLINYRGLK